MIETPPAPTQPVAVFQIAVFPGGRVLVNGQGPGDADAATVAGWVEVGKVLLMEECRRRQSGQSIVVPAAVVG